MVDVDRLTHRTKGEPPTNRRIELKSMLDHEEGSTENICYQGKQVYLLSGSMGKFRTRARAAILTHLRDQKHDLQ